MRALARVLVGALTVAVLLVGLALLARACLGPPARPVPASGAPPGEVPTLAPSAPLAGAVGRSPKTVAVARPDTAGTWRLERTPILPAGPGWRLEGVLSVGPVATEESAAGGAVPEEVPEEVMLVELLVERAAVGLLAGRAWDAPRVRLRTPDGAAPPALYVAHPRPLLALGLWPTLGAGAAWGAFPGRADSAGGPAWWAGAELLDVGPVGLGVLGAWSGGRLRPALGASVALWEGLRLAAFAGPGVAGAGLSFRLD